MAHDLETVLKLVKVRLNRLTFDTSMDEHLTMRIQAADEELGRMGIHLIGKVDNVVDMDDAVFLGDYVVWKYQNRDSAAGMPEWLKNARRERWLSGKGRITDDTG
jgi:hypothetical protein